jgi:membrane associated rhomboid family serine protease
MAEIPVEDGSSTFVLDICRACQTVWFDPHEYESLHPRDEAPPPPMPSLRDLPVEARERIVARQMEDIRTRAYAQQDESDRPADGWKWIVALLGLPVEMDGEPRTRTPWVIGGAAVAIAVVSLLAFTNLQDVVDSFGLVPTDPWRHGGVTLLTSFLLHGGIAHLLGNLYFLLVFGDNVEDALGHARTALLLVLASLAGDALHVLADAGSTDPCIGASGGISGLVAYYALRYPKMRLGFMWRILFFFRWFSMPAYVWFALWTVLQCFGAWSQVQGFSNVSALAHLGGASVGLAFWLFGAKPHSP